jgi:hypothetical protein
MKLSKKLFVIPILIFLLALTFAAPARAFDGRGGDKVVIQAGEVVDDDLYIGASEVVIDGTVNGDVVAFAETVTVNGVINGDLIAAGQTIVVNGEVSDDARIAGSVLFIGGEASIGSDLVAAGYSVETRQGSVVGQDVVVAAGQILLAGETARNAQVAGGAFTLRGSVGGDVSAEVGEAEGGAPMSFPMQSTVPVPVINPGLTIDPDAHIGGDLQYTQTKDLTFPSGIVAGKIRRIAPQEDPTVTTPAPTPSEQVGKWALGMMRIMVTLILIGLFLGWLFPNFIGAANGMLQSKPLPSLGWGVVAYAVFFFALLLVILAMVVGGIIFGALTLGGLSGTVIWLGLLAIFGSIVLFVLATSYVTKVLVGTVVGKWILQRTSPSIAEHKVWPMVIGIIVVVFVIELLRFPLAPLGFFGWLLNFAVILLGLGALWLWGRERFAKKPVVSVQ